MDHGAKPFKNKKIWHIVTCSKLFWQILCTGKIKSNLTFCPHNEKYLYIVGITAIRYRKYVRNASNKVANLVLVRLLVFSITDEFAAKMANSWVPSSVQFTDEFAVIWVTDCNFFNMANITFLFTEMALSPKRCVWEFSFVLPKVASGSPHPYCHTAIHPNPKREKKGLI